MKRGVSVVLGTALVAASASLAGCTTWSDPGPDYDQLCVDAEQIRHEDWKCDGDGGGGRFHWLYMPYTGAAHPVGSKATHPNATTTRPGSGVIARGGFGGARGGSSGG